MDDICPGCGGKWGECQCSIDHDEIEPLVQDIKNLIESRKWTRANAKNALLNLFMEILAHENTPLSTVKSHLELFLKMYFINLERKKGVSNER